MGLRTKGGSVQLKEKIEVPWRALKEDKLGAVIFGCKHHTIEECLQMELFGLPAAHYAYVKNVPVGLTLYLFNYSDRKLHGIFEAVSCGGMNISPHAWITSEGTEHTPYPAQVRIREQRKCRPLIEDEIKPIIANNYYSEKQFLFELDKAQNRRLMELFLSPKLPKKMPCLKKRHDPVNRTNKNMFDCLSNSNLNEISDEESKSLDSEQFSDVAEMRLKENEHSSSPENSSNSSAQEMKWTDLFKPSLSSVKDEVILESPCTRLSSSTPEVCQDAANTESDSSVVECWEDIAFEDDDVKEIYGNKEACLQYRDQDSDRLDMPSSENITPLDGDGQLIHSMIDYVLDEEPAELFINKKEKVRSILSSLGSSERDHDLPNFTDRSFQKDSNALSEVVLTGVPSSGLQYVIIKVLSKAELDQLKKSCRNLGRAESSASDNYNMEDWSKSYFKPEESVFIAGGFDGHSWLPDFSLYSPYQDHVISLCSMNFTRSYTAMAKLSTELYIFGGTLDGAWCDKVESYNPINNQWVQQQSLKRRKGGLAGASMHDQIFAIGGGDEYGCFSEVELFDQNIGSWISSKSMLEKRFAPAAANMSGALYVAGGYDGSDYLRSFERFDPREGAWTRLGVMNVKRGCHSLVVFNDKLYALGGYDGDTMVSSVEVFDPRIGWWMMGEAMRVARAHVWSFVAGGKMWVLGGMRGDEVLDVMECYEENSSGWQVIGPTTLGKRSSYCALIL